MKLQSKKIRYFIWILPAAVAVIIFMFSAQSAHESSRLSNGVVMKIVDYLSEINPYIEPEIIVEKMSAPVRKAAHITEYAIFYLTLLLAWYVTGIRKWKWVVYTLVIVFLYACSDELHQMFVSGRAGRFTDVMIDCIGGIVISVILILKFVKKDRKLSKNNSL